jgi:putative transposase
VSRQCELLGLARSTRYYRPSRQVPGEAFDLFLKGVIDRVYTQLPAYGSRRMTESLEKDYGFCVGRKRVRRLMREMGLCGLEPRRRNTSQPHPAHPKYPYLLRGLAIVRPDHVWCSDITYVPLPGGFAYLCAVMDWHSRRVLAWELSNTMDTDFCQRALLCALARNNSPEIFNTDQGSQFTSREFTGTLEGHGIRVSMDGRGRCFDNIFIERLWRSVKYEDIYLNDYRTVAELRAGLTRYFGLYNGTRRHQALDYQTPDAVYRAA